MFQVFKSIGPMGRVFYAEFQTHIEAVHAMYDLMDTEDGEFHIWYSGV